MDSRRSLRRGKYRRPSRGRAATAALPSRRVNAPVRRFSSTVRWREAAAAFHHLDAAALHQLVRRARMHLLAVELDRALGDLAALGMQQVGDRLQRRGLARTVGAQERDNAALGNAERHALQHQDDVAVDHLDVVHREERRFGRGACERVRRMPSVAHSIESKTGGGFGRRPDRDSLSSPSSSRAA